jgi:predicted RND superfamily exporter protein
MVVGGFVWKRGAMGLFGVPERVFSLLAYASVIVQGTSFALHKFTAIEEHGANDRTQGWLLARSVDGVITTTAMISAFGFLTLWTFGLKPIRELGVAAALGVVWLLWRALVFLPAFDHLTTPDSMKKQKRSFPVPTFLRRGVALSLSLTHRMTMVPFLLEQISTKNRNVALWLTQHARPWWMLGSVCALLLFVGALFFNGNIHSRTKALEFIRGTVVEQEARALNQPGNVGFEFLDLLVEPAQGGGIMNPRFVSRAWELQTAIKGIPGSRETSSILGTVRQISLESFKKPLPETIEEIAAAFFLIENRLAPAVQRQLYFPGGVRISVSYGTDDSVKLGQFRDAILDLARRSFPDLKVSAFNKVPLYPQVDKYVREGKVYNVLTSQIGVACLCGLILWRGNRQLRRVRLSPLWGGVVMSLPLCFATAVLGVTMWLFHIPLDMATAPIGALAINAATDFSLYFVLFYQKTLETSSANEALHKTLDAEGKVIFADCLLNTCCFLPLLTSHFLPVRQLGWMMGLMLMACAAGTLLLMAVLLPWCVARKESRYVKTILPVTLSFEPVLSVASSERRADRTGYHHASAPAAELAG